MTKLMKNLFLFLFLLIFSDTFTQIVNYDQFDSKLFDQLLIDKINNYRLSVGLKSLFVSNTLKNYTSEKTATYCANNEFANHMKFSKTNDSINQKLYEELYYFTNGLCGTKSPSNIFINEGIGEIISVKKINNVTYEELATITLKSWLDSPGHKKVIESQFTDIGLNSGMISCSSKLSKTKVVYTSCNFVAISNY